MPNMADSLQDSEMLFAWLTVSALAVDIFIAIMVSWAKHQMLKATFSGRWRISADPAPKPY